MTPTEPKSQMTMEEKIALLGQYDDMLLAAEVKKQRKGIWLNGVRRSLFEEQCKKQKKRKGRR